MRLVFYVLLLVVPSIVAATPIRVQKNFSALCPKGTTRIAQCGIAKGDKPCTKEINITGSDPAHSWSCKNDTQKPCPVKLLLCEDVRQKFVRLYQLSKAAARKAELARKAASRKAELARKAAARKAELARKAAARKAELARKAASRKAELARKAASRKDLTVKEFDGELPPCQEPSITEAECGQGNNVRVCEYKVNIDLGEGARWSCDGDTENMCPVALRLCSESNTKFTLYTLTQLQEKKTPPPRVILTKPKPKPFRFSLGYDQIQIPKKDNDNILGGFVFPIISTNRGLFGLDLGLGHSLERNLYTRVGLVYDYTLVSWFEVGSAVDVTFIPGGSQDESNVYFWSAGARLRAALVIPKTVLAFRPSLGVSFGYSYGHWEATNERQITEGLCGGANAPCAKTQEIVVREGAVFSINPTLDFQFSF